jgi:hypothetical protein
MLFERCRLGAIDAEVREPSLVRERFDPVRFMTSWGGPKYRSIALPVASFNSNSERSAALFCAVWIIVDKATHFLGQEEELLKIVAGFLDGVFSRP